MTLKKAFLRGILGIPIGVFIMSLVGLLISLTLGKLSLVSPAFLGNPSNLTAYSIQFILSCVIGFAFAFSSAFFQVEKWSIAKQTFLHFITIVIVYFPTAIYLGWVELKSFSIIIYASIFIFTYVTIWLSQYSMLKKKIQKLNNKLCQK
ncbi:MAG TPA: DUF3021 domain-containing protein [Ruminiclostridium sp.]